jgi:hypothetical protein
VKLNRTRFFVAPPSRAEFSPPHECGGSGDAGRNAGKRDGKDANEEGRRDQGTKGPRDEGSGVAGFKIPTAKEQWCTNSLPTQRRRLGPSPSGVSFARGEPLPHGRGSEQGAARNGRGSDRRWGNESPPPERTGRAPTIAPSAPQNKNARDPNIRGGARGMDPSRDATARFGNNLRAAKARSRGATEEDTADTAVAHGRI